MASDDTILPLTYCIFIGQELWERWMATSRRFGYTNLENSEAENRGFVRVLLDIADVSPIELSGSVTDVKEVQVERVPLTSKIENAHSVPATEAIESHSTCPSKEESSSKTRRSARLFKPSWRLLGMADSLGVKGDPDYSPPPSARPPEHSAEDDDVLESHQEQQHQHRYRRRRGETNQTDDQLEQRVVVLDFATGQVLNPDTPNADLIQISRHNNPPSRGPGRPPLSAAAKKGRRAWRPKEGDKRLYQCRHCPGMVTFRSVRTYCDHLKTHGTGLLPFECSDCGKQFKQLGNLQRHSLTHTGLKPHKCDFEGCGKSFAQSNDLICHIRTHTNEKPYLCDICPKAYKQKTHLIQHRKAVHHGMRPFRCGHCGQGFARKLSLQLHIRTHTGEKPWACAQCGKQFAQRSEAVRHMSRHEEVLLPGPATAAPGNSPAGFTTAPTLTCASSQEPSESAPQGYPGQETCKQYSERVQILLPDDASSGQQEIVIDAGPVDAVTNPASLTKNLHVRDVDHIGQHNLSVPGSAACSGAADQPHCIVIQSD